jgi:hypothetical protein
MNSNCLIENLGGGVVLFKNAISLDWDSVFDIAEELVDLDSPSMYKPAIDPEKRLYLFRRRSRRHAPQMLGGAPIK